VLTAQPDTSELAGRVALVTGAARGQGRAVARRLRAAGATIVAGDVLDEVGDLVEELGHGTVVGHLDVRDPVSWAGLLDQGVDAHGRLDILVNNAGVLRRVPIERETPEGFTNLWEVNCLGAFLGIKAALGHLRQSPCAAVVNTSSLAGLSAWTKHASYVSSKWAVRGLTKVAALELAADRIRVNAVFPGPVATPMMIRDDDPQAHERLSRTPIGRIGEPEDIAEAVLFLVSDRSAFITGCELVIDGGQHAGTIFTGPERL
jgi:NAD(P)-dependent dehydrogenase (short-subunit alcohol dehydrogenase family)